MKSEVRDMASGEDLIQFRARAKKYFLRPNVISVVGLGTAVIVVILGLLFIPLAAMPIDSDILEHFAARQFELASSPVDLSVINPSQGLGGLTLPMGVWFNPSDIVPHLWLFNDPRMPGLLIAMLLIGGAVYILGTAVSLPRVAAILAAQFIVFAAFPPFLYWTIGWSQLNLSLLYAYCRPGLAIHTILGTLLVAVFFRLGKSSKLMNLAYATSMPIIVLYSVLCSPLYAPLFFFPIAFFMIGLLLGSPGRGVFLWRLVGSGFCLLVLLGLRLHTFYHGLYGYAARAIFPNELYVEIQQWDYLTNYFSQGGAASLAIATMLVGCGAIAIFEGKELRWFALSVICFELALVFISFTYVYSGIRWHLPLPVYLEYGALPIYLVVGLMGTRVAVRRIAVQFRSANTLRWIDRFVSLRKFATTYVTIFILPFFALVGIVNYSLGRTIAPAATTSHSEVKAKPPLGEIQNIIESQLALDAGGRFRGSLASLVGVPGGSMMDRFGVPPHTPFAKPHINYTQEYFRELNPSLSMTGLWNRNVPTLEDNSHLVTPAYHFVFSRALSRAQDFHSRNWVIITKPHFPLMAALGAQLILTDQRQHHRLLWQLAEFTGHDHVTFYLYQILGSNLGHYSPVETVTLMDAPKALELMETETFDFQKITIVHTDRFTKEQLVPADSGEMLFERGGVRIRGRSRGRSLLVIPLQFSNSLQVEELSREPGNLPIQLLRVNLLQTGLFFERELNVKLKHVFGPFREMSGRLQDIEDCRRLGIAENGEIPYPPNYQPRMIPAVYDFVSGPSRR